MLNYLGLGSSVERHPIVERKTNEQEFHIIEPNR